MEFDWDHEPPMTDTGFVESPATPAAALALADVLEGNPGTWVTFRRDGDLALVPGQYSNLITPEAIYGLDPEQVARLARHHAEASPHQRLRGWFHGLGYTRRPVGVVFAVEGTVLSSSAQVDLRRVWTDLGRYLEVHHSDVSDVIERFRNSVDRPGDLKDEAMARRYAFQAVIWMTEKAADDIVGAKMWGDTYKFHPEKPAMWRKLLTGLGYDAVEDRDGALTGDCGHQIAVLNPDAVRVKFAFDNPASAATVPSASVAPAP